MANYDRRILIPYLRDVCTVEMLCGKIEREIKQSQTKINEYSSWANRMFVDPPKPNWSDFENSSGKTSDMLWGCFLGGGSCLLGIALMGIPILGFAAIAFGIFQFWLFFSSITDSDKKAKEKYNAALEEYMKQVEQNEQYRQKQSSWKKTSIEWQQHEKKLTNRLHDMQELRTELYAVNIIPSRYRNVYAAYYLFDFFTTSRETDLEKVIQTMLLDEIIQRLDKIIVQNEQIIVAQRVQIALQEQQNRSLAEHQREELLSFARMERNQELQMDYQNMIARNQQVTNFILAADYIQQY